MSLVNRNKVNMESIVIHTSKQHMEKTGETRKYQNYPNLGVGARGISNRNRIYSKSVCSSFTYKIPTAPTAVAFISSDSNSITLLISSSDIQTLSYLVTLTPIGGGGTIIQKETANKSVTVDNLDSNRNYSINVKAYNPAGYSTPYIETYSGVSPYYTSILPPNDLIVTAATLTSISISYAAPITGTVLSYVISYTSNLGTNTITGISNTTFTYQLTGLTAGTQYTISVAAVGTRGQSSYIKVIEDTLPEPISNLVLTANNTTSILVTYNAPQYTTTIDKYEIVYGLYGGSSTTSIDIDNTITSYTLDDLIPGTRYTVSVYAHNTTGMSTPVTADKYTYPNPPSSISVGSITKEGATITFGTPSLGTAASYILTYYRTSIPSSITTISNATSPYIMTGLLTLVGYTVKVKSVNTTGNSSEISTTFTTVDGIPSVPRNLRNTSKTDSSITIAYDAPLSGIATQYNITYLLVSGYEVQTLTTTANTYTITGLISEVAYFIRVTASNSYGTSPYVTFMGTDANQNIVETTVKTDAIDVYVPTNFTTRLNQNVTL